MLVRDAPQLEVFMLRRNLAVEFMGGAYVFPGGAVDAGDRAPELLGRCHGRDDSSASTQLGVHAGGMGFWVAAIREAFEEAGCSSPAPPPPAGPSTSTTRPSRRGSRPPGGRSA